jgi:hypothetical protein
VILNFYIKATREKKTNKKIFLVWKGNDGRRVVGWVLRLGLASPPHICITGFLMLCAPNPPPPSPHRPNPSNHHTPLIRWEGGMGGGGGRRRRLDHLKGSIIRYQIIPSHTSFYPIQIYHISSPPLVESLQRRSFSLYKILLV